MTKEKIIQRTDNKEQLIIQAIKKGACSRDDIVRMTGLNYGWISNRLRLLFTKHDVTNLYCLTKLLVPPKPALSTPTPAKPKFLLHNHVIVDTALAPVIAAHQMMQMLGGDYCLQLIDALVVACVPKADDEGEEKAV